jgi:hypothetical protein
LSKLSHEMPERDLDEWDAEIEAEFQRVTQQNKAAGRTRRGCRHIGCPLAFIADVCGLTRGRHTLVVALYIYRRTVVCKSRTVTLPGDDLAELGISRGRKQEALARLDAAKLVRVENATGLSARVTLVWEEGGPSAGEDTHRAL